MTNSIATESSDVDVVATQLRQELDDGRIELPLLPSVAAEVLTSSLDEQSDAARFAGLIQQDQTLAARMIRIVNSPAFRGAVEIVALQQAIARLGMQRIREIALSASLKGSLFKKGSYDAIAEETWQVVLAAGLWAKEVARASRRNVEIAYLCGLLHSIGAPLILSRLGELAPDLARTGVEELLEALTAQAGARLAEQRNLPEAVTVTIEHLHRFEQAGDEQDLVAVTECGVGLARWMCTKSLSMPEVVHLPAMQHLNLYPEDVEGILENESQVRTAIESMS
ncbi:MAG: HDOD domain-containing protein [Pseudomonadales bacterium]